MAKERVCIQYMRMDEPGGEKGLSARRVEDGRVAKIDFVDSTQCGQDGVSGGGSSGLRDGRVNVAETAYLAWGPGWVGVAVSLSDT